MDRLEYALLTMSRILEDKQRRHIIGGVLIGMSVLFGTLALTVISIKNEENEDE